MTSQVSSTPAERLVAGGVVVPTTPQIRYYGFILTRIRGRFPRTSGDPEGYDGGHLHYFTFADVRGLLEETGTFGGIEEFGLYRESGPFIDASLPRELRACR